MSRLELAVTFRTRTLVPAFPCQHTYYMPTSGHLFAFAFSLALFLLLPLALSSLRSQQVNVSLASKTVALLPCHPRH